MKRLLLVLLPLGTVAVFLLPAYRAEIRYRNCGAMAMVAMYVALGELGASHIEARLVTAKNPDYWETNFRDLTFGHTWLELGPANGVRYCVDPWADVVCLADDYASVLAIQLKTWSGQGKRIAVDGLDVLGRVRQYWLSADDSAVLSLAGKGAQRSYLTPGAVLP